MRASNDHALYGVSAALFAGASAITIAMCRSMAGGMDMPGDWTMSMAWMKMPGQSWPAAILMFMQMWLVMMVAMMMPSLLPMLVAYRRALRRHDASGVAASTVIAAVAYFAVWQVIGAMAYAFGVAFNAAAMQWAQLARAVPALSGALLLLCGALQLSRRKMSQLHACRDPLACIEKMSTSAEGAWKRGIELGTCCASCCTGFMLALLVLGVMDLAVMAVIALAITAERVLPKPDVAVRLSGALMLALGVVRVAGVTFP